MNHESARSKDKNEIVTMRCSEPGHRAPVAIHASCGPGRWSFGGTARVKQGLKRLVWTWVGAMCGAILGVLATLGITLLSVALSPKDPSAGSVGIIIILFLPVGFFADAIVGFVRSRRKS